MRARPPKRMLFTLAAFIAVVVIAFWRHGDNEPRAGKTTALPVSGIGSSNATDVSPAAVLAPHADAAAPPVCEGQTLALTLINARSTLCLGSPTAVQNGSVRSYRFQTTSGPTRSLRIDAVGTRIFAAYLSADPLPHLQCRPQSCLNISIGKRNPDGVRTISFRQVVFAAASEETAIVNGDIQTAAEDRSAGTACNDEGVSLIAADGSTTPFCSKGGVGFEIGDDGNTTYRFTNLDNESLLVVLSSNQQVQRVALDGESSLVCRGADCRQVQVSKPNAAGERTFTFSGTSLVDARSGESNVVLNGTLVVPPL
jgi:hypothetical protein